jgi:hypothetical protein
MGKRAGGLTFCVVLLTVAALAGPASSQAAQTIGQTGVPLSPPCFGATYRQATLTSGAAYSTPTRGVVTAWSTFAGSAPTQTLQFVTIHPDPATPGSFIYDGVDIERNISPGTLNTFSSGVRLPIVAGGEIGIHLPLNSQASCIFTTVAGDNYGLGAGTPTPGSSQAFSSGTFDMARVDVSAKVEPDVDGDGFGDETQDLCPTNPASQSACAKKCKKKHHKHSSASAAKKHKRKGCKKKKRKK